MKTLKEEWESYKQAVYPSGVPVDQERECKMVFYAGCAGMFGLMNAASEYEEDIAVQKVSVIYREMENFKLSVQNKQV